MSTDTLTDLLTTYLVEKKTTPLGLSARDILSNTNAKMLVNEHIKGMISDVDRCINQYIVKHIYQKAPAIPAIVKYLEYDKAECSYTLWGEESFNLAYVLNSIPRYDSLDPSEQDSLWCVRKAKNLALIHWDGCDFELEYNDEDWMNYYEWREICSTGHPITLLNIDDETIAAIFDNDIRIEIENIGEGLNGDYNEDDPADINLLRIRLYSRNYDVDILEWSEEIDGYQMGLTTCTQIPANTPLDTIGIILTNVYIHVRKALDDPENSESLKHIIQSASWLSDTCLEIPDLRGTN